MSEAILNVPEKLIPAIKAHVTDLHMENMQIVECRPGYAKISVMVDESNSNLYGHLHGGLVFTLIDIASGMATYAYGVRNVTVSSSTNFMRKIPKGIIYAECDITHIGKTTAVSQVKLLDDSGKIYATGSCTLFILEKL